MTRHTRILHHDGRFAQSSADTAHLVTAMREIDQQRATQVLSDEVWGWKAWAMFAAVAVMIGWSIFA